jgi:hypothetical protein
VIVRNEPNGAMLLIGQTDHSRLVGQLAAHWGNERFDAPAPYASVVRAAAYHDYGWLRYETWPFYDQKTGTTPEFRRVPGSARQLESYAWCSDWLLNDDPYSSLLVKMHRTGLWRERYKSIQYPEQSSRSHTPEVETFIAKAEAEQEVERASFDVEKLWTNFRLFEVWDLLGLYFCCQDPFDEHIEPVPVRYGGERQDGVQMTMKALTPRKVAFDPYPFDLRPLRVQLYFKRLTKANFADDDAFRRAYFTAESDMITFELV